MRIVKIKDKYYLKDEYTDTAIIEYLKKAISTVKARDYKFTVELLEMLIKSLNEKAIKFEKEIISKKI